RRRGKSSSAPRSSPRTHARAACCATAPPPAPTRRLRMSYMLLIVEPHGQRHMRTLDEGKDAYQRMVDFGDSLPKRGLLVSANALKESAVRLKVRNDKPSVLDGPFTEAKEFVGGFYLLSCETRDEALALAEQCPAAQWATVEVREIGTCYE